jgi:hypothetical protein
MGIFAMISNAVSSFNSSSAGKNVKARIGKTGNQGNDFRPRVDIQFGRGPSARFVRLPKGH